MALAALEAEVVAARGVLRSRAPAAVLVRARADGGQAGWGEAPLLSAQSGSLDRERAAFRRRAAGIELANPATWAEQADADEPARPLDVATQAALWDLAARLLEKPVYDLLGGRARHEVLGAGVVAAGRPRRAASAARRLVDRGFTALTVESSGSVEADDAALAAVRSAAGRGVTLRLRAGRGHLAPAAAALLKRLEAHGVACVEPLDLTDAEAARLRSRFDVPVAAAPATRAAARRALEDGVPALVLDTGRIAADGLVQILDLAAARRIPCALRCRSVTRLLPVFTVHVAAASPAAREPIECGFAAMPTISIDPAPGTGVSGDVVARRYGLRLLG